MSIQDLKIGAWKNPIVNEADRPNRAPADMKAVFDSNSNELRDALNNVIDAVELAAEAVRNDLPDDVFLSGNGTYGVPKAAEAANGIPSGGVKGQVLVKNSENTFDASWVDTEHVYMAVLAASDWADGKQTISIADAKAKSVVEIIAPLSDGITDAELDALQGANLQDGGQTDGSITVVCRGDVPEIDIPIRVIVRGNY